ncbi:AI-2E family transporter [Niabella insulamsoli]|uniref:AI-2E family transporter n=1 Tax=Niabella insulamsoli TaxID=3144874 RepID=UPI0031FCF63C
MYPKKIEYYVYILLFIALSATLLYFGKPFLIPLIIGGMLAGVFVSFCRWMESRNINRGLASLLCVFGFLAIATGIIFLLGWQVSGLMEDASSIKTNIQKKVEEIQNYIAEKTGVSAGKQQAVASKQTEKGANASKLLPSFLTAVSGLVINTILVLVYMFLLLYQRSRIKHFILKLQKSESEKATAASLLEKIKTVIQQYLGGLGMMIVLLWVLYGIGFSVAGVKYALFFAVLCGLLEIVPFFGNITGTILTLLMAISQGGGNGVIIGVLVTYAVVQFVQTYILEPLVVGDQVNINPLFTIIALVFGELLWGLSGMVVAIPMIGILKIICEHVPPLAPYAYLIGQKKKNRKFQIFKKS